MQIEVMRKACALAERLLKEDPVGIPREVLGLTEEQYKEFLKINSYTLLSKAVWWRLNKEEEEAFKLLDSVKIEASVKVNKETLKDESAPYLVRVDFENSSWIRYSNGFALDVARHVMGLWLNIKEANDE